MNKRNIIKFLSDWGHRISRLDASQKEGVIVNTSNKNPWFTNENISTAISGILRFLDEGNLAKWLQEFDVPVESPKTVGLVLAGNIPLVGFHDILCVLAAGHHLHIKLSRQDDVLIPYLLDHLQKIDKDIKINYVEKLNKPDAVIATGSDNSSRYFEYYFRNIPHIIRKNRISVGVLNGNESNEKLESMGNDIFQYFGLGCRNISKLYLPKSFNFNLFFEAIEPFQNVINQNKYFNNYEYNKSIFLVNSEDFKDNGFVILKEDSNLVSPISVIYYEYYQDKDQLLSLLETHTHKIQVIASDEGWVKNSIDFGQAQMPDLWDYADNINTMEFLMGI